MSSERLKMIDLFCGAGGLSEGLSEAGFHSLFASEIVPVYAQTYQKNHPNTTVFTADIRELDANEVQKSLGIERGALDLIAGGPPCQGFSINAPIRTILDERNHLFKEYLRFVDAFAPRAVLIENVPGLVSFEHGATLHAILDALAELGYGADVRILGAPYYGVPQMRWRTIILGVPLYLVYGEGRYLRELIRSRFITLRFEQILPALLTDNRLSKSLHQRLTPSSSLFMRQLATCLR